MSVTYIGSEMFPDVQPSTPATWDDVLSLARHEPAARHAVMMLETGQVASREEALIVAVFMLYALKRRMFNEEAERRAHEEPPMFVTVNGQRYVRISTK